MSNPVPEFAPWLGVFETLRVVQGLPLFMKEHRSELEDAMETLGLASDFDFDQARSELPRLSGRWRWLVTPEGTRTLFSEQPPDSPEPIALSVSPIRVGSCNWDAQFKTISYLTHVQAWKLSLTPETVLLNENGDVASGSRTNIFWRKGDHLFTPSRESGCRHGVVRHFVIRQYKVKVGPFPLADLQKADEIFLTNSMKGILSVNAMEDRPLTDFSCADGLRAEYEKEVDRQLHG